MIGKLYDGKGFTYEYVVATRNDQSIFIMRWLCVNLWDDLFDE